MSSEAELGRRLWTLAHYVLEGYGKEAREEARAYIDGHELPACDGERVDGACVKCGGRIPPRAF